MPLSKARDKERKQRERAQSRLDSLLSPSQTIRYVQPKPVKGFEYDEYDLDADGNIIPEY